MTPADAATLTWTANPDTVTTDDRQFSVSGLDNTKSYNVALIPGDEVTITDGQVVFGDNEGTAAQADDLASVAVAQITVVNGSDIADTGQTEVNPVNGGITFTVDGLGTGEVRAVVYLDADNDNQLDLDANDKATEAFGVSGETTFLPIEATGGAIAADQAITKVSKTADYIVAGGKTYFYDANDNFRLNTVPVTMAAFEAALSSGDDLDGTTYAAEPELVSTFDVDDKSPVGPTAVAATVDATNSDKEIDLAWTAEASIDSQDIYRRAMTGADAATNCENVLIGTYTKIASVSATANTYTDNTGLSTSTRYCYSVLSVKDGDPSTHDNDSSDDATTTATPSPLTPKTTNTVFLEGANTGNQANILDNGDRLTIQFDRLVTAPTGATIRVYDLGDGDEATLTCGTNATCTVSGDNSNVVTVILTADPALNIARGNALISSAAASAGFTVLSSSIGNTVGSWNIPGSSLPAGNGVKNQFENGNLGDNDDLGAIVTAANINANTVTSQVRVDAAEVATGDIVTVYNSNGVQIGSVTVADGAVDQVIATTAFAATDTLSIVKRPTAAFKPSRTLTYAVAPFLTDASFTDDPTDSDTLWGDEAGDKLTLTFSSSVTLGGNITGAGAVDQAEVDALLGSALANTSALTATATVSGNVLTLTVVTPDTDANEHLVVTNAITWAGTTNADLTDGADAQVVAVTPVNKDLTP